MIHYGMTKTAQLAVSRGLAETTAGTGVTVNAVLPGQRGRKAWSNMWNPWPRPIKPDARQQWKRSFSNPSGQVRLLKRFATPEEVAAMVTFVASPLSSATNGAALRVDGGVVAFNYC